jgi:hypothetical protein
VRENKSQPNLFNPDKYKVKPILGKPEKPKQGLEDFTKGIFEAANSSQENAFLRKRFHWEMTPKQKRLKPTELEQKVKLITKTKRFLAQLEQAGVLNDVLHQEWTAEIIPQIVAKVKAARKIKLDPKVEKELQEGENRQQYWEYLYELHRQKKQH